MSSPRQKLGGERTLVLLGMSSSLEADRMMKAAMRSDVYRPLTVFAGIEDVVE